MRGNLNIPEFINEQLAAPLKSSITLWSEEWNANIQTRGWWWRCGEMRVKLWQLSGQVTSLPVWSFVYLMGSELLLAGCMMSGRGGAWDGPVAPTGLSETSCDECSKGRWRIMSGGFLQCLCDPLQAQPHLVRSIHPSIHQSSHSCVYVWPVQHTHTHMIPQFLVRVLAVCQWRKWGNKKRAQRGKKSSLPFKPKGRNNWTIMKIIML